MTLDSPLTERPICFIAGLHRSGTSLIHRCLAAHPEVSGFQNTGWPEDEGQFLQTVLPMDNLWGGPGLFALDPAAHWVEEAPEIAAREAAQIAKEWAPHYDLRKKWLIEKTPANLVRTRRLQQFFPNARFIFVVRHPVVAAMATMKWTPVSLTLMVQHALRAYGIMAEDLPHLRQALVIKYEAFVEKPQFWLDRLYEFLDLPSHPLPEGVRAGANATYEARLKQDRLGLAALQRQPYSQKKRFNLRNQLRLRISQALQHLSLGPSYLPLEYSFMRRVVEPSVTNLGYNLENFDAYRGAAQRYAQGVLLPDWDARTL